MARSRFRERESGDWLACIPNAHPGYISWERFQENLKILESNGRGYELARASPPREGAALLARTRGVRTMRTDTSVFDMPRDEAGRKPGMSVIVGTLLVASGIASRSREVPLTEPSDRL